MRHLFRRKIHAADLATFATTTNVFSKYFDEYQMFVAGSDELLQRTLSVQQKAFETTFAQISGLCGTIILCTQGNYMILVLSSQLINFERRIKKVMKLSLFNCGLRIH